jgi:hypothetical protein
MTDDQLAAAYLTRLRRAAGGLPRARRRELLEAIQAHIAEARAAGAVPLRDVLDGLGEPEEIAAAAGGGMRAGAGGHQIAAVVLLLAGGAVFFIGWFAGVVLLWTSDRWRWYDKLLGTLVWPGGLAGVAIYGALFAVSSGGSQVCSGVAGQAATCVTQGGGGLPDWLRTFVFVLILAAPVAVAIRLLRLARRTPNQDEPLIPEPAVL